MTVERQQLIEWRRIFHANPELSNEEYETTRRLREILESYHIHILNLPMTRGLVAEIGQGDDFIALRADIDALPIDEQTGVSYQSQKRHVMHACGHDIHMAAILGTAIRLKAMASQLPGRIRIIFQSAEETGDGAWALVKTGVLDGALAVLGFHNDPSIRVGEWRAKAGYMTANVDRFQIHIKGVGAHAAMPHQGSDPHIVLSQLTMSLQTIVSRNIAPYDEAVVTIGQMHCGETWNVIPQNAMLEGTVRSFNPDVRDLIEKRMQAICDGLAQQFDVEVSLTYQRLAAAVNNDETLQQLALTTANEVGYQAEVLPRALTIGEDFSSYQHVAPVHFAMIGSESPYPLHHAQYQPNEAILEKVPEYFIKLIQKLWKAHGEH
ncbi:amidohydrolase [Staphylococcus lutrae]|uniref:N-acetyl-L,L-diaminopimelate deacetylase n=1 Tax=Staphylococcus lutrae TaxID=155085 RepID=A0AAC9RUT5_9STAP|nr:amidohydrolase [Staphylococcus lutrae]ARJ51971.1 N-acetyl-L,L-diaminopimelate deacetylase [Staphylococcus lutrae]PNZ38220.1 amidohydrolase [Staphylococcus lutrae]